MNKRRRDILAAMESITHFALAASLKTSGQARDVPGLALKARVSADTAAELMIYGYIGGNSWMSDGISASDVATLLREAGPGPINVRINSGGGDAFQGIAIHTLLSRHQGTVTTFNDGLAASAASVILLAGDKVVSARNAMTMIHDAMTATYGNKATHDRAGELLDKASQNIADLYAEKCGEDADHWRELMTRNGEDGFWYTGTDAMEAGLVDELTTVADDGPDDDPVWSRLAGWSDRLPTELRAQLQARQDAQSTPAEPSTQEDEPTAEDVSDEDYAYRMSMWAYLNGHAASKDAA